MKQLLLFLCLLALIALFMFGMYHLTDLLVEFSIDLNEFRNLFIK